MAMPPKHIGETDDEYDRRMVRESNERIIEQATGSTPSRHVGESKEEYASRIEIEANKIDVARQTGNEPRKRIGEGHDDYARRVATEADEAEVEKHQGYRPSRRWGEPESDYRQRVRLQADKIVVERESGSSPSRRWGETEHEYAARMRNEARAYRAGHEDRDDDGEDSPTASYSPSWDPDSSSSGYSGGTSSSNDGMQFIAVLVVFAIAALLIRLNGGSSGSSGGSSSLATAFVTAPDLNVRAGPDGAQPVVTVASRNEQVELLGNRSGDWTQVRAHGVSGWASSRYLADHAGATAPAPAAAPVADPAQARASPPPLAPGPVRITLQYQEPADRRTMAHVRSALKEHADWRVGSPEHVLPAGENRPETYGGVRYFYEQDSVLARTVCTELQAELARRGYTVVMPLWPMLTRTRLGLFKARPGLIEVWVSPLPPASAGPAAPGQCGR
jgi:hypothetical protein